MNNLRGAMLTYPVLVDTPRLAPRHSLPVTTFGPFCETTGVHIVGLGAKYYSVLETHISVRNINLVVIYGY